MAKNTTIIQARYDKTHIKPYYFKFHIVNDADVIDKLSKVDSRQDYIRQLIREDLNRNKPGSVPVSLSAATMEVLTEKAAQTGISVPDLISSIINECIMRDMIKNAGSVPDSKPAPVSAPESAPKTKTEEEKNMKTYHIKPEYFDTWFGKESPDPDYVVTQDELENLSREWETPVPELLEQLIEID